MARADAQRNRQALIEAAEVAFEADGFGTSLEGVARTARVGIGTLYRHFPTRASLVQAVFAEQLHELCDSSAVLLQDRRPDEAFRAWARTLPAALPLIAAAVETDPNHLVVDQLEAAVQRLIDRGVAAGIFGQANGRDVLLLLCGLMIALPLEQDRRRVWDMIDLVIDGLRFGAGRTG